ncbi:hypothetical protein [Azospirillum sp.]|uniref:hypothetical protein n=1 Tax=Azospirillum sp. TaxID=34012 RepID=UPI003D719D61
MTGTIIRPTFGARPIHRTPPRKPTPLQLLFGIVEDLYAYVDALPRHQQAEARRIANRLEDIAETINTRAPR